MTNLRSRITAQEKQNVDLMASNAPLGKSNAELATQLEVLKSKYEELFTNDVVLVEENARIISQMDGVKDELVNEKAVSTSLKFELEVAALKVQTIAVDSMLSARAELMGEHSSWDPD